MPRPARHPSADAVARVRLPHIAVALGLSPHRTRKLLRRASFLTMHYAYADGTYDRRVIDALREMTGQTSDPSETHGDDWLSNYLQGEPHA